MTPSEEILKVIKAKNNNNWNTTTVITTATKKKYVRKKIVKIIGSQADILWQYERETVRE